ncbi:hypothetical protein [uncultured Pseudoalteromonas sp.]|uniref:hypothetical protein n=1 Tax=uncultured Pseudoalteromonas sp. TaxID=114053 RepID=UPI00259200B8|nr:hypothetical protein [uncultured Pseudoalteromonas sp.]
MGRSSVQFDRWKPREKSTWVFRVFKQHNAELLRMFTAFENSQKYTFKNLGKSKAKLSDLPSQHFDYNHAKEYDQYKDLSDWTSAFNDLENWINLNALVTISSNFETYLSTVIPLALSSDLGVLYGVPNKIDGIDILKNGHESPFDFKNIVINCTKGTWSARLSAYEKAFGRSPSIFSNNLSTLDIIRNIRNDVAHAFGRDIDESRNHQEIKKLPIKKLSRDKLIKYQELVWKIAKSIDVHLHNFHIGEYQAILFYHEIYSELNHSTHPSLRAMELKKRIGTFGTTPVGKEFCKGLVNYYESL